MILDYKQQDNLVTRLTREKIAAELATCMLAEEIVREKCAK